MATAVFRVGSKLVSMGVDKHCLVVRFRCSGKLHPGKEKLKRNFIICLMVLLLALNVEFYTIKILPRYLGMFALSLEIPQDVYIAECLSKIFVHLQ